MEKYKPLLIISLAFTAAVWSYIYYFNYQSAIAENRVKAEREQKIQKLKKQKSEIKAGHILVKTFEEAEGLRKRILAGEDFEKLAQEFSLCPSGKKGGGLGYVRKGQMVPEFEQAVFSLPEGEISEPVETEFGWHLVKVTDIVLMEEKIKF